MAWHFCLLRHNSTDSKPLRYALQREYDVHPTARCLRPPRHTGPTYFSRRKVNDITLCVTELTSSELLTKVLQVIRDVK